MNRFEDRLTARTHKKSQNWYLRSWVQQEINGKKQLVYTGEYYKLLLDPSARRNAKIAAAALYVLLCSVYLGIETTLSQGGLVWYAGAPCLLAVIPLFYLGLGVWNLVRTEEYFTYRRRYAAFTRLRIGGWGSCILLGFGTLGQAFFLLQYRHLLSLKPELIFLFGALICFLLSAALLILKKNTPVEEVSPKEYPGEKR